jgi:hypothetical protein
VQKFLSKFKIAKKRKQVALQALLAPPIIEVVDEEGQQPSSGEEETSRDTFCALERTASSGNHTPPSSSDARSYTAASRRTISVAGSSRSVLVAIDCTTGPYPTTRLTSVVPLGEENFGGSGIRELTADSGSLDSADRESETLNRTHSALDTGSVVPTRSTSIAGSAVRTLSVSVCSSMAVHDSVGDDSSPSYPVPIMRAATLVSTSECELAELEAITTVFLRYKPHEWERVRQVPVELQVAEESYLSCLPTELACVKDRGCEDLMARQLEIEQLLTSGTSLHDPMTELLLASENEAESEYSCEDDELDQRTETTFDSPWDDYLGLGSIMAAVSGFWHTLTE